MEPEGRRTARVTFDWSGLTLFLITIGGAVACLLIVKPFLPGLTAAVVLAIVTERPHRWICSKLNRPILSATVSLVLVALSIVVPTIFVVQDLGQRIVRTVQMVQSGAADQGFRVFLSEHPRIAETLNYAVEDLNLGEQFGKSAGAMAGKAALVVGRSIYAISQVIVMLFVLFFLYRDKAQAVDFVRAMLPLDGDETDFLLGRLRSAVQALVLGRFLVAGTQGLLAGVVYAALGLRGAALLGVATMLTALVPAVGAWVVWMPIVIFLTLTHHWVQALILLGVGLLIISTLDNVLYPILVGSQLRLHTVPIFLAMLGGVVLFGVVGLILGPVAFSGTTSLVLIWRKRIRGEALPALEAVAS